MAVSGTLCAFGILYHRYLPIALELCSFGYVTVQAGDAGAQVLTVVPRTDFSLPIVADWGILIASAF